MGEWWRYYRWQPGPEHADGGKWVPAMNGDRPVVCQSDEVPIGAPRRKWEGKGEAMDLFGILVVPGSD